MNNKIDWKRKLTSRKFWLAIIGFVTQLLIAFNYSHVTVEKITGVIMSAAIVIAYIIGEGLADSANDNVIIQIPEEGEEECLSLSEAQE